MDLGNQVTCPVEKEIVLYEGIETIFQLTGFEIQAYKTFQSCFDDILAGNRDTAQVSEADVTEYKRQFDSEEFQAAMGFITYFEGEFTCSGICDSSLFYYTLPLDKGPPANTCLVNMKDVIANNLTYMGMASTLAGIVMAVTWLCQY